MSGDMTDLVERLRQPSHINPSNGYAYYDPVRLEAAFALEAKAAEIAALKERLSEQTRMIQNDHDLRRADISRIQALDARLKSAEARAETAERELTRERETFQLHEQTLRDNGIGSHSEAIVMVTKLRCELHEARAALKPFSDAAESLSEDHLDRMDLWESPAGMEITAGHLRAARAVHREGVRKVIYINFQPKDGDDWLKWPLPGLTEDQARELADYLASQFKWCSHYTMHEAQP